MAHTFQKLYINFTQHICNANQKVENSDLGWQHWSKAVGALSQFIDC